VINITTTIGYGFSVSTTSDKNINTRNSGFDFKNMNLKTTELKQIIEKSVAKGMSKIISQKKIQKSNFFDTGDTMQKTPIISSDIQQTESNKGISKSDAALGVVLATGLGGMAVHHISKDEKKSTQSQQNINIPKNLNARQIKSAKHIRRT
jgi:hypothetical protein